MQFYSCSVFPKIYNQYLKEYSFHNLLNYPHAVLDV